MKINMMEYTTYTPWYGDIVCVGIIGEVVVFMSILGAFVFNA